MKENKNHMALCLLDSQDWQHAQQILRENAKKHPCYQTYNNYGYYLITEGILCKNGKTKNALKLGTKYIIKALNIKRTVISVCAMVKSLEYQIRDAKPVERNLLYQKAYKLLEEGLEIEYSDEMQYNLLRYQYLLNPSDEKNIEQIEALINNFVTFESVSLYFGAISSRKLRDKGDDCIAKYGKYIDEVDLLMFYAKTKQYKEGFCLCEKVFKNYSMDKFISSAIIECCVNTNHFDEATLYSDEIMRMNDNSEFYVGKLPLKNSINLFSSSNYRKMIIDSYLCVSPYLDRCCYFGCTTHGIVW